MIEQELTVEGSKVACWYGLRYANAGRFMPPVLADFDPDADSTRFGAAPMQVPPAIPSLDAVMSEDCHFLNIWAPSGAKEGSLPVIVMVYGGGFEQGAGSTWAVDGSLLAATGEVVVGSSAGGFIAAALPAISEADGLYSKLSIHSAAASRIVPASRVKSMAQDFLKETGLEDNPGGVMSLGADQILAAQGKVASTDIGQRNSPTVHAFGVVDDTESQGAVLDTHPMTAFADGRRKDVSILVSTVQDEIALFRGFAVESFDPATIGDVVEEIVSWGVTPGDAAQIVESYLADNPEISPGELRSDILTDYIYRLPAVRTAKAHADAGGEAWLVAIGQADEVLAGHACDTAGLVGRHMPGSSEAAEARDQAIFDMLLGFATGRGPGWEPLESGEIKSGTIGELRVPAGERYNEILEIWDGVERP